MGGAERIIGIFADTLSSVASNSLFPLTYSLEDRRKAAQFMSEKSNVVIGILVSKSLQTRQTRKNSQLLHQTVVTLDNLIKYKMLPLDNQILGNSAIDILSPDFVVEVGNLKVQLDTLVQTSYSLIAKIKTNLT